MSVMPVLLLLITAEGLRRGRRAAWLACSMLNLTLFGLGVMLTVDAVGRPADQRVILGAGRHLFAWLSIGLPVLQPLLVFGLLVAVRHQFSIRAPDGTYREWARLVGSALCGTSAVYVLGSLLLMGGHGRPPELRQILVDLPLRFLPPGYLGGTEPAFVPVSQPAMALFEWTGPVFWAVVAVAGLGTFTHAHVASGGAQLDSVRALLRVDSGSSLGHMTTWPGHTYWFTCEGQAAVAYRVIARVAITTGGPIGTPVWHRRAMRGFVEHCRRQGWTPCWYSVTRPIADLANELGFGVLQVAEEIVLPLRGLTFTGRKWQDVRTAINRADRAGIVAQWCRYRDAPRWVADQIRTISEDWVAEKGLPEMGFTLGGLDELLDDDVRLLIAVDAERTVHGVTSWLPIHRDGQLVGWTLDFMRRRTDGFAGATEFLIASAALRFQQEATQFLSLSGAPLARVDRGHTIGPGQRLVDWAGRRLEPVYGFGSLFAFKAKFQPDYRPLFLCYPDPTSLPRIGNALVRAYLPRLRVREATQLARMVLRVRGRTRRPRRDTENVIIVAPGSPDSPSGERGRPSGAPG
jgi:lysylphosphatidylglycerol synthetase-like protein (DUF2156 family)